MLFFLCSKWFAIEPKSRTSPNGVNKKRLRSWKLASILPKNGRQKNRQSQGPTTHFNVWKGFLTETAWLVSKDLSWSKSGVKKTRSYDTWSPKFAWPSLQYKMILRMADSWVWLCYVLWSKSESFLIWTRNSCLRLELDGTLVVLLNFKSRFL